MEELTVHQMGDDGSKNVLKIVPCNHSLIANANVSNLDNILDSTNYQNTGCINNMTEFWRDSIATILAQTTSEITLLVVIMLLGSTSNLMVFIIFYRKPSLLSKSNRFVLNLSLCNFLMSVCVMPVVAVNIYNGSWSLGDRMCSVFSVFVIVLISESSMTLLCITIDRYYAIAQPLHYTRKITTKKTYQSIGLTWFISTVFAVLPLAARLDLVYNPNLRICFIDLNTESYLVQIYVCLFTMFCFITPLVLMMCVYVIIFGKAKKTSAKSRRFSVNPPSPIIHHTSSYSTPIINSGKRYSFIPPSPTIQTCSSTAAIINEKHYLNTEDIDSDNGNKTNDSVVVNNADIQINITDRNENNMIDKIYPNTVIKSSSAKSTDADNNMNLNNSCSNQIQPIEVTSNAPRRYSVNLPSVHISNHSSPRRKRNYSNSKSLSPGSPSNSKATTLHDLVTIKARSDSTLQQVFVKLKGGSSSSRRESKVYIPSLLHKDDWKAAITGFICVSTFTLSWIPIFLIITLRVTLPPAIFKCPQWVETATIYIAFLSCILNPLVYVFRSQYVKREFEILVKRRKSSSCTSGGTGSYPLIRDFSSCESNTRIYKMTSNRRSAPELELYRKMTLTLRDEISDIKEIE